ncbi:MAG: SiaB family protein kinase [Cytophagales bacterium]|nr:SiaB family protein kinase [Cytophagales bacterium]
MEFIYDLHKAMLGNHLILVYEGDFTQEITKSVLAMAERNMDSFGEESSIKRKVFNVMVECLQNIVKHCDEVEERLEANSAVFMIGKSPECYWICSGNPVRKGLEGTLAQRLNEVNELDKDGLKKLYKDIIKNSDISEKGGAGLGFVDMARKSGNNLEFGFKPINDELTFFTLRIKIART